MSSDDYYGRHAYMLVHGFAVNAHTGEPAFVPDYPTRRDRSAHAALPTYPNAVTRLEGYSGLYQRDVGNDPPGV